MPFLFLWALLPFLFPSPLIGHPLDLGVLALKNSGRDLDIRLELNPVAAARLIGVDPSRLFEKDIDTKRIEFFNATLKKTTIQVSSQKCAWRGEGVTHLAMTSPQNISLSTSFVCQSVPGKLSVETFFFKTLPATFQLLIRAQLNEKESLKSLDFQNTRVVFESVSRMPTLLGFMGMGMKHIGVFPSEWLNDEGFHIAFGIDHILFVLALLLAGGSWISLLKVVTGFTVGHTLSLALALTGIVSVSSRWVEAAIALTIAFVAAGNFWRRQSRHRWWIATGIGLIHGLGFANALSDLRLAGSGLFLGIIGFNLGVELGQGVVVLLFFSPLKRIARIGIWGKYVNRIFSAAICGAGMYWFVKRAWEFQ